MLPRGRRARLALALAAASTLPGPAIAAPTAARVDLPGVQDVLSSVTVDPPVSATDPVSLPGAVGGALSISPFGTLLGSGGGPSLLKVLVPSDPVTGLPSTFTITASDPSAPIRGVSFDFGEAGSHFGESSCRRHDTHRRGTFAVPYTFRRPGLHTIRLEIAAGSCSALARVTDATLSLLVGQGTTRTTARTTTPDSAVATSTCNAADALVTAVTLKAARNATLCLLNAARVADGRRRLRSNRLLRRIATAHSVSMVAQDYFDHTEPPDRTLLARLQAIHWTSDAGENLGTAGAAASPREMMQAWLQSSGHRANILYGAFRYVGVGMVTGSPGSVAGMTVTTDFGGRRPRR